MLLLLCATAALSCSAGLEFDMSDAKIERSITVIGTASDIDTKKPIEEIKVTLHPAHSDIESKSSYTDNQGKFTITIDGFTKPTSFTISAEDPKGIYESSTHEISLVTWDLNYSSPDGNFFVNEEHFYLKKK